MQRIDDVKCPCLLLTQASSVPISVSNIMYLGSASISKSCYLTKNSNKHKISKKKVKQSRFHTFNLLFNEFSYQFGLRAPPSSVITEIQKNNANKSECSQCGYSCKTAEYDATAQYIYSM